MVFDIWIAKPGFGREMIKKRTIVTHYHPDLDAAGAAWLIKRFWPGWQNAKVISVPAGGTLGNIPPDADPNICHVDTGLGQFDHHQGPNHTSATKLVFEELKKKRPHLESEALDRLVKLITEIDLFQEVFWPEPTQDRYELSLHQIIGGWYRRQENHEEIFAQILVALDGVYQILQDKVWAEKELITKGIRFKSPWGPAIGLKSFNDEVISLAQKQGFKIALRKDPKKGYVRIKAQPNKEINFSRLYQKLKKLDPKATWYLHPNGQMLLNGSTRNPKMKPTKLSLTEVIEAIKNLKIK